jgi:DNA-binding protein H-NS
MLDTAVPADLTSLSKKELEALQRQVQEALAKSEARRKQDALEAAEAAVKEFGFTLAELLPFASNLKQKTSRKGSREAKFRNPENPNETWSGRGRRPLWFTAQLQAGKSEADLRV